MVRSLIGNRFIEVYVDCTIEECAKRDPKGLYTKALRGEISNFTGISAPYEPPPNPEIHLDTTKHSIEYCVETIVSFLNGKGMTIAETVPTL